MSPGVAIAATLEVGKRPRLNGKNIVITPLPAGQYSSTALLGEFQAIKTEDNSGIERLPLD